MPAHCVAEVLGGRGDWGCGLFSPGVMAAIAAPRRSTMDDDALVHHQGYGMGTEVLHAAECEEVVRTILGAGLVPHNV